VNYTSELPGIEGDRRHIHVGDFFARRDPERTRKRLIGELERLDYTVTLQEGAAPT
jgi:hypothetical protein